MVYNNIKELREKKGYTQEKLARETDITLRHLQNIENNRVICSVEIALKIYYILQPNNFLDLFFLNM